VAVGLGLPSKIRNTRRIVLGRHEWLALPVLGVGPLHVKTDTGARSSSLHAEEIELGGDGNRVSFVTKDHWGRRYPIEADVIDKKTVRSSSGEATRRIFIETEALIAGGFRWKMRISLAGRSEMRCPMLLGRQGMRGCFLIDPQSAQLAGDLEDLIATYPGAAPP
jgi:ribosomal protein S6--L-glutamate ligase